MKRAFSDAFEFSVDDLKSIGKGAAIATAGAVLTWSATLLVPAIETTANGGSADWRRLGLLLAAAVASSLVNAGRKFIQVGD